MSSLHLLLSLNTNTRLFSFNDSPPLLSQEKLFLSTNHRHSRSTITRNNLRFPSKPFGPNPRKPLKFSAISSPAPQVDQEPRTSLKPDKTLEPASTPTPATQLRVRETEESALTPASAPRLHVQETQELASTPAPQLHIQETQEPAPTPRLHVQKTQELASTSAPAPTPTPTPRLQVQETKEPTPTQQLHTQETQNPATTPAPISQLHVQETQEPAHPLEATQEKPTKTEGPISNLQSQIQRLKSLAPQSQTKSVEITTPNAAADEEPKPDDPEDDLSPEDERPLSEIWQEIQGSNHWDGLLDPMNSHLRREIIRYGEFAQACYDCFDFDPHSKYCGSSKYQGHHFFDKLDMPRRGYQITRFLYATSDINLPNFFQEKKLSTVWSTHANWMGYVAVCTDDDEIRRLGRRDILIAWRGTVTYLEWISDLKDILQPAHFRDDPSVKLEYGFYELYTKKEQDCKFCTFSAREQVLAEIKRLVDYYTGEEISITITGHSLGAALALISAYDLAEMRVNIIEAGYASRGEAQFYNRIPITVFSFSGPRVGNLKFKERCEELGIRVLRVHNAHDKVPTVPGILANEKMQFQKYVEDALAFPWSYAHVGVELALDHTRSPFLKQTKDMGCAHNLEALLHLVDGYHGEGRRFRLVTKRDIALVNKSCNFLKSEYGVPPNWRQDENKGMVRAADGRWVVPERPRMEAHPADTAHHLEKVLKMATSE